MFIDDVCKIIATSNQTMRGLKNGETNMKCEKCKDQIYGTATLVCKGCQTEETLKSLVGLKVVEAGLIQGVPAVRLSDGSTVWIENVAKDGVMTVKR